MNLRSPDLANCEYSEDVSRTQLKESRGKLEHPRDKNTIATGTLQLLLHAFADSGSCPGGGCQTSKLVGTESEYDTTVVYVNIRTRHCQTRASAWSFRRAVTAVPTPEVIAANSCEQAQVTAQPMLESMQLGSS